MPYFYFDTTYLIFVLPALLLALFAQARVQSAFRRYSQVMSRRGVTGREAAARVLHANGVTGVRFERVAGHLTDHYDPRSRVIRLSESVEDSHSVAAIGVACHEAGHAVQYAMGYFPMRLRSAVIPISGVGSRLAIPLILLGSFLGPNWTFLTSVGLLLFSTVALFQLVTLPVEFDASRRALAALEGGGILDEAELGGARRVLSAAAMTYVAALLTAVAQLLRLLILFGGRGRGRRRG